MSETTMPETGNDTTPDATSQRLEKILLESRADEAKLKRILELRRITRRAKSAVKNIAKN